jgi:hypothetical protein
VSSRCKEEPFNQISSNLEVPIKISSNSTDIQTLEASLNFYSNFISNLEKFL